MSDSRRLRRRKGYSKLNSELVAIRGRGLSEVDTFRGSRRPLQDIEEITELSNAYTSGQLQLRRAGRISILVTDAAEIIEVAEHKRRVELLFGLHGGGYESATSLRRAASLELGEDHLSESARVYRDRQAFKSLEGAIRRLVETTMHTEEPSRLAQDKAWRREVERLTADLLDRTELAAEPAGYVSRSEGRRREAAQPFMAPPDIQHLVGRTSELALLHQAISKAGSAVVQGVQGMAGIGKTSLAIRYTHQYRGLFRDGVLWGQLDKAAAATVLYAFAQAYGRGREVAELPDTEAKVAFIQAMLDTKDVLVVLDNASSSEEVEPLLRAASSCPVIVTTRAAVLAGLENVTSIHMSPLPLDLSLELLAKLIGPDRVRAEEPAASELWRLTGGLPLALRILAERAQNSAISLVSLARRLREQPLLRELRYGVKATKDTSVEASFEISFSYLSVDQQRLFALLGTFEGADFDTTAVAYVAEKENGETARLVEDLSALALVERSAQGRWRLHPLMREYAKSKLTSVTAKERMAAYYVALAEAVELEMRSPNQAASLSRVDSELTNIEAVIRWTAAERRSSVEARLVSALLFYWSTRGYQKEVNEWLTDILSQRGVSGEVRAKTLLAACYLSADQGDFATAYQYAQQCLEVSLQLSDDRRAAWALDRLASVAWCQNEYTEAKLFAERSLDLWRGLNDQAGIATVLNILGLVAAYEEEHAVAVSLYSQSLQAWKELGDERGIAMVLGNLGEVRRCLGDLATAESCYADSLALRLKMGDKLSAANVLNNLGELMRHRGKTGRSHGYYEQGLRLAARIGNGVAVATSLSGFAGLAALKGQWRRAAQLMGAAEGLLEASETRLGPANMAEYQEIRQKVISMIAPEMFARELLWGKNMTIDEATRFALQFEG